MQGFVLIKEGKDLTSRGINAQALGAAPWSGMYPKEILHRVRLSRRLQVKGPHPEGEEGTGTPAGGPPRGAQAPGEQGRASGSPGSSGQQQLGVLRTRGSVLMASSCWCHLKAKHAGPKWLEIRFFLKQLDM